MTGRALILKITNTTHWRVEEKKFTLSKWSSKRSASRERFFPDQKDCISDHVFVPSLPMVEAILVTPDWTLFSRLPSFACSLTFEDNSVALSAAVLENFTTESFATPAHLVALTLILEIDDASNSWLEDEAFWLVLPKPQYFGLPLPSPDECSCSFELLFGRPPLSSLADSDDLNSVHSEEAD